MSFSLKLNNIITRRRYNQMGQKTNFSPFFDMWNQHIIFHRSCDFSFFFFKMSYYNLWNFNFSNFPKSQQWMIIMIVFTHHQRTYYVSFKISITHFRLYLKDSKLAKDSKSFSRIEWYQLFHIHKHLIISLLQLPSINPEFKECFKNDW